MKKPYAEILCAASLAVVVIAALCVPKGYTVWAWLVVSLFMIAFVLWLGVAISGRPLGVLINEQNLMSLSRFQTALWTIIVVSALLVIAGARVRDGVKDSGDPLNIKFSGQLLSLLGISSAALVGSPLIDATKKSKPPGQNATQQTAVALSQTKNVPASSVSAGKTSPGDLQSAITANAQGILYKNPAISDASFSDMFEGTEVGNAAQVDLAKVQMFFFTLIVAVVYIYALVAVMNDGTVYDANLSFPALSDGMVALLGISNAGFLGYKAVDHTGKT
jgi:hypothetical protein